MTKAELLSELSNTYVMLKPSTVEGIGVFAIQQIKKGCREMFSKPDQHDNWITVLYGKQCYARQFYCSKPTIQN